MHFDYTHMTNAGYSRLAAMFWQGAREVWQNIHFIHTEVKLFAKILIWFWYTSKTWLKYNPEKYMSSWKQMKAKLQNLFVLTFRRFLFCS